MVITSTLNFFVSYQFYNSINILSMSFHQCPSHKVIVFQHSHPTHFAVSLVDCTGSHQTKMHLHIHVSQCVVERHLYYYLIF